MSGACPLPQSLSGRAAGPSDRAALAADSKLTAASASSIESNRSPAKRTSCAIPACKVVVRQSFTAAPASGTRVACTLLDALVVVSRLWK